MPKISIIVPVNNTEQYLPRCIDSILSQTFTDFELLLIDDGSTDNSGMICDEYAAKDSRIRVFHKENGGVSSARNLGLDNAQGEWIAFVDSDDWVEVNWLSICNDKISHDNLVDFIKWGYIIHLEKLEIETVKIDKEKYIEDAISMLEENEKNRYYTFTWTSLCKRSTIGDIRFDNSLTWCEDHLFIINILVRTKRMYLLSEPLYHYRKEGAETLSNVKNPYMICNASTKILSCIKNILNNDYNKMTHWYNNYRRDICYAIKVCYKNLNNYRARLEFHDSIYIVNGGSIISWSEKIFRNKYIPFYFKDLVLRIYYAIKKS